MNASTPLVSVTITTKNEAGNLPHCLKSLKTQSYQNIEILVVDNFSTDQTPEIAKEFNVAYYALGPERSAQRNFGMLEKSRGEFLLYLDADMIAAPNLIAGCVKRLQEKVDEVALHLPEVVLGKNYFSSVRRFERRFYNGTAIDGARFFRASAFVRSGGFDPQFSGPEDWDLDLKIKQLGKIGLFKDSDIFLNHQKNTNSTWELTAFITTRGVDPALEGTVIYHNEAEFDLRKYLKKKTYYAGSFSAYQQKWGRNHPMLKKQFGFFYRFFGVFLEDKKWLRLLSRLDLVFGMYFLRFLVGLSYLKAQNKG